jgi:hypothetical protein
MPKTTMNYCATTSAWTCSARCRSAGLPSSSTRCRSSFPSNSPWSTAQSSSGRHPAPKRPRPRPAAVVAFEVDSYEADGRTGWSVMVQGMVSEVTDPVSLREVDSLRSMRGNSTAPPITSCGSNCTWSGGGSPVDLVSSLSYSMKDHQTDTSEREPPWPNQ